MSRLEILYEGRHFVGKDDDTGKQTFEQMLEALYEHAGDITRLKLPLADGSWIVLPREAVRRAVFLVFPTSDTSSGESYG